MKKAIRISYNSYFEEKTFLRNLELVRKNADIIDEITLFTEPTHHGYWPIERERETASVLADRIKRYREAGVERVGLNVLCTIGHNEDGAEIAPLADNLQYMANIQGVISRSVLCPSDDRFLAYVKEKYEAFCRTGADFIWIDDDVRISSHGFIKECCFCPKCLERFNKKFGARLTIEDVRELFPTDIGFRTKWLASAHDTFTRLFSTIRDTVKSVAPNMDVGYMSGAFSTEREWIEASGSTLARPGGGFYNDLTPISMFEKSFMIGQCITHYPETVKDIQYEYESYNFLTLQKSNYISELESSLMILAGCDGMLYNRWEHTQDFMDMMRASAEKWDILAERNRGCRQSGVYCISHIHARALNEIGIPVTPFKEAAIAFYILSSEWDRFCDSEIEEMLSRGVYTDGLGLKKLAERGFTDLGGKAARKYENGVWEYFTDHKINGNVPNRERFTSLDIFHEADAYELIPDEGAEVISMLKSAFGGLRGACAYIYRRKDGSYITVDGCLMPKQIQTDNKRDQMTGAFELLSKNSLPVIVDKCIKVVPTVTVGEKNVNIMLVNAHFDNTGTFDIRVRGGKDFKILTERGELIPANEKISDGERVITLDALGAWQYVLLVGSAL